MSERKSERERNFAVRDFPLKTFKFRHNCNVNKHNGCLFTVQWRSANQDLQSQSSFELIKFDWQNKLSYTVIKSTLFLNESSYVIERQHIWHLRCQYTCREFYVHFTVDYWVKEMKKLICSWFQKNYMPMSVCDKNQHAHVSSTTTYCVKARHWHTLVGYLQKHKLSLTNTDFMTYKTWKYIKT